MSRLLIPRKCYLHVPGEAKEGFSIVLESFVLSKHQASVHSTFLLTLSTLNHLSGYTVNSVTSDCLVRRHFSFAWKKVTIFEFAKVST